jgi:hypothetical protein
MSSKQIPSAVGAGIALVGLAVGAALTPVAARVQTETAPIERGVVVTISTTTPRQVPKAHWGIYALAEYDYSPSGKKMTVVKKNDLIVEQDMGIGQGFNRAGVKLKSGEYEIHVQPDNSREIVKHFLVDNLSTTNIALNFDVAWIEDPEDRRKVEVVRLGPPLGDLEARVAALEKKNGIASPGDGLPKKTAP